MAAFNPESFAETEEFFEASGNSSTAVILSFYLNGSKTTVRAKTDTRVYECRGLTKEQADDMCARSDYNFSDKTDAIFTSGMAWCRIPDADGFECRADKRRINDAGMWRVIITHAKTTVLTPSGWTRTSD